MKRLQTPIQLPQAGLVALLLAGLPTPGRCDAGLPLDLPAPFEVTASRRDPMTSLQMPVGPYDGAKTATATAEGPLEQTAWRTGTPGLSTLQLLAPLRAQITAAGFALIYECETQVCGGFDFRFGVSLLPEPDMHVDLSDFRYLAARRDGPQGPEFASLMVSRSTDHGFVQLTRIGGAAQALPEPAATTPAPASPTPASPTPASPAPATAPPLPQPVTQGTSAANGDFAANLASGLSLALEDLIFPSGSQALAAGDYASLAALADWLRAHPASKVALIGHSDASGGLAANIALSRQRAQSVRQRLIDGFAIPPGQIDAEGVGYLSPRDSNFSPEGKQRNRRVEVMLTAIP